jgi:hypothetical protein
MIRAGTIDLGRKPEAVLAAVDDLAGEVAS